MIRLLIFILLFIYNGLFGQTDHLPACKIEFYLLKDRKPNVDPDSRVSGVFSVSANDLADTPFIKDQEIIKYVLKSDSVKFEGRTGIVKSHWIKLSPSTRGRLTSKEIPLCCGRHFALVVNGQVIYGGYLCNMLSSFSRDAITIFAFNDQIKIMKRLPDYSTNDDANDPRMNKILMNCLTLTGRLANE